MTMHSIIAKLLVRIGKRCCSRLLDSDAVKLLMRCFHRLEECWLFVSVGESVKKRHWVRGTIDWKLLARSLMVLIRAHPDLISNNLA